jgi:hypothetical protein
VLELTGICFRRVAAATFAPPEPAALASPDVDPEMVKAIVFARHAS